MKSSVICFINIVDINELIHVEIPYESITSVVLFFYPILERTVMRCLIINLRMKKLNKLLR